MLEHFGYDFNLPEVSRIERAVLSVRAAVSQKIFPFRKIGLDFVRKRGYYSQKGKMIVQTAEELGALIRRRRKNQGLTIEDLASVVPCSPRLLSELERGKRGVSITMLMQLMALIGLELDLYGREEYPDRRRR